jgi:hypothetical protein
MCGGISFSSLSPSNMFDSAASVFSGGLSDVFNGNSPFTGLANDPFFQQQNSDLANILRLDPTGLGVGLADTIDYTIWSSSGKREDEYNIMFDYAVSLNSLSSQLESKHGEYGSVQANAYHKQFLEWVFQYGDKRKMEAISKEIDILTTQYQTIQKEYDALKANYDQNMQLGEPEWTGVFSGTNASKISMSAAFEIYINIKNYEKTGDSKYLRQAFKVIVAVVALVLSIISAIYSFGTTTKAVLLFAAALLSVLSAMIVLDGMFGGGALMDGIMKLADFLLNDILNIDSLASELQTDRFTKGSEHYEETKIYIQVGIAISALILSVASSYCSTTSVVDGSGTASKTSIANKTSNTVDGSEAVVSSDMNATNGQVTSSEAPKAINGGAIETGILNYATKTLNYAGVNVSARTLSNMWDGLQAANQARDIAKTVTEASELTNKLEAYKILANNKINKLAKAKFDVSYTESAYISNQTDMAVNTYALEVSMSENNQLDVFDPEGTIAMNVNYKQQPKFLFGFEDMFQESKMAGSSLYTYNILWK